MAISVASSGSEQHEIVQVDINIYGPSSQGTKAGDILTTGKVSLQQPDYYKEQFQYENPHAIRFPEPEGSVRLKELENEESGLERRKEADMKTHERSVLPSWLQKYESDKSEPASRSYNEILWILKEFPTTGIWILKEPAIEEWLTQNNEVLWLFGPQGAGKTVLSTIIIDALRDKDRKCSFIYCEQSTRFLDMILDLLNQQTPHYRSKIDALRKRVPEPRPAKVFLELDRDGGDFVVIDGLDKLQDANAKKS